MTKPAFLIIGFILNTLDLVFWFLTLGPIFTLAKLLQSRTKIKKIGDTAGDSLHSKILKRLIPSVSAGRESHF
jgi:hypothetical protein